MENRNVLENTQFEKITDIEGRTSFVESIAQDKDGFMWIGTTLGLLKYDGYHFIQYKKTDDLLNITNLIFSTIYLDKEGTLWAGGQNRIFVKYDRENDELINLNPGATTSTINVRTLTEDFDGNILMGTDGEGIKIYFKKENIIKDYFIDDLENSKLFSNKHIEAIFFTKNKMLIGTKFEGMFIYDFEKKNISNPINIWANKIFRNTKNSILIGANEGLYLYDESKNSITMYENVNGEKFNSSIRAVCEDKNKNLWLGKGRKFRGLTKIEINGNVVEYESQSEDTLGRFPYDQICCVFVDLSNVLWIGTLGGGLRKIDLEEKKFLYYPKLFRDEFKTYDPGFCCIQIDGDIISVGQQSNLDIYRFSKKLNGGLQLNDIELLSIDNNYIITFFETENLIWFINYREIIEYNKNSKSKKFYENPPDVVFFCAVLKDSMIIIGAHNGTLIFDTCTKKFINLGERYTSLSKFSGRGNSVRCFCLDRNTLWFGTFGDGLFKYNFEDNSLINYRNNNDEKSISDNQVTAITQDSKGNIWIGTQSSGICKFDIVKSEFIRYSIEPRLNGFVTSLLEDNYGYLWVVSSNGICKFDINTESVVNFYENKGIKFYNEYKPTDFVKDKDGIMYYAGPDGLTYFNPDEIKDNPYIPNIVLTDFQIFNESVTPSPENPFLKKSITYSKEINLTYSESVFSLEFAALIYNNPSKNQYAYQMEGFDKDWVYCGTRRNVTYTNLDPGDYTFRVKGSNNDGIWNEEGTSIKISITPPWWQTWWFKSCGASLILLTIGFGYKKRLSKLKKEKEVQEEYSRKLLASQEEERKRIANELHDSIAHDILILKNTAVYAMSKTKDEKTKNALSKISEQSTETLNDVRNISYNLHPHQIEALGITKAIRSIIDKSSGSFKVNFIHDIENIDKIFTEENEVHIFRVVQEAISNIIKYSDSPEAIIKISCTKKSVSILISDIGKGFDIGKIEKGSLGLSGISERVKILGGTLDIESKKGEGTVMKILIPC